MSCCNLLAPVLQLSFNSRSARMSFSQVQRVFTEKQYLASHSYLTCQNEFKDTFPDSPVPNESTVSRLVNRFLDTGSVQDRNRSSPISVLSDDSLDDFLHTLLRSPRNLLRKRYLQSALSHGSNLFFYFLTNRTWVAWLFDHPVPKPGRTSYVQAKSFHLISLTSFLLKTMERLVDRYTRDGVLVEHPLHSHQQAHQTGRSVQTALHITSEGVSSVEPESSTARDSCACINSVYVSVFCSFEVLVEDRTVS
jgi:hypothetical protein